MWNTLGKAYVNAIFLSSTNLQRLLYSALKGKMELDIRGELI